jgi:hypothetical protein
MIIQCPHNDHKTMITYMRSRTGPNCFRVYYKNSCVIRFTPKEVGRVFGIISSLVLALKEYEKGINFDRNL